MCTTHIPHDSGNTGGQSHDFRRGDHLRAGWPGALHHDGIYLGSGVVVHLIGPSPSKADALVRIDSLAMFAAGRPVTVRHYAGNHDREAIVARALSQLGEGGYHLLSSNCQHFARWCATGVHLSEQVESAAATAATAVAPVAAASAGISMVASAGVVTGLSGPGIMTGLAAYGSIVGGGAVAGLMLLGTAPALTSVAIMRHALREDDDLPEAERAARKAARIGSAAGGAAGIVGGVAAVRALGVPGLSAAGISSGLAAIGAPAGRGMAAGTMAVVAVPAVAAAVAGYLAYRIALWWLVTSAPPAGATGNLAVQ